MIKMFLNIFIILSISNLFIGCGESENDNSQEIITLQDDTTNQDNTTNQNSMKWDDNNWDNSNWQ